MTVTQSLSRQICYKQFMEETVSLQLLCLQLEPHVIVFIWLLRLLKIALKYMTPVILLTDGYIANGTEPWRIPSIDSLPKIDVKYRTEKEGIQPLSA